MALSVRGQQQIRLDVGAEAQVRVGSKVRLAAWQDPKNRGAAATKRSPAVEKSEDGKSLMWTYDDGCAKDRKILLVCQLGLDHMGLL